MRPPTSRNLLLRLPLLLLVLLLPLAAAPLHAGTIERLGDLDAENGSAVSFPSDSFGSLVGSVGAGADARVLACIHSDADRESLWTFGATPESAQPFAAPCPAADDYGLNAGQLTRLEPEGDAGVYLYVSDTLWRTDGTPAGTYELLPLSEVEAQGILIFGFGRQALVFVEEAVLFGHDRLLVTDGTLAGTRELARFQGSFSSAATLGDAVIFATATDYFSTDLWRSDGTAAGTRRLARIGDGAGALVRSGNRVFVQLDYSLWVTDGTEAGTRLGVEELLFDFGIYPHSELIAYRGGIAFEAEAADTPNDEPPVYEVWWSDGTPGGTRRLARLPSNQFYGSQRFRVLGSQLLFPVEYELWSSDGTPRGTGPIAGCRGGCPQIDSVDGVELGGMLLVGAYDQQRGYRLWRTDGTGAGTRPVREVCPGSCGWLAAGPEPWRGGVAYLASDDADQLWLWYSDGTRSGTRRLVGLGEVSDNGWLVAAGDRLYAMLLTPATGWQLWTFDGTAAGTLPLTRRLAFEAGDDYGDAVRSWARTDGGVFVDVGGLLSSDGTRAGTHEVAVAGHFFDFVGTIGDLGIAQRATSGGSELLSVSADGGEPAVIGQMPSGYWIERAIAFRDGLALDVRAGFTSGKPHELWTTDGTAAGTARRLTFANADATLVGADRGLLYFTTPAAPGSGGGSILWKSDGSEAGTQALVQRPGLLPELVRVGEELFFVAGGRSFGRELWRTDGTPAGTRPYFDDGGPRAPRDLAAFAGALYVAAAAPGDDEEGARAVWRLDPSTGERTALGRFATLGDDAWTFAAAGEHLFFAARETRLGGESVYATDGTAAGTIRVAPLSPPGDPFYSLYPPLPAPVALGDELLFTALDPLHGKEPWSSDGTVAGTRLLRDLVPGAQGSSPVAWVVAGGRAFFAAGDGVRGAGLFLYDPAQPGCASNGERVCLAGRWEAEAAFPPVDDSSASVPTGVATSTGGASAFFAHPQSGEPLLALRAAPSAGGASIAVAGLTREWWIGTVTDTVTGEARRYVGLPGAAWRYDDRAAFPAAAAAKASARTMARAARPLRAATVPSRADSRLARSAVASLEACAPNATTACLLAGRFGVRGHRGDQPAALRALGEELALLVWPGEPPPAGGAAADPDAAVRVAPLAAGGYEVFFAALAPTQGAAVVHDDTGKSAVYANAGGGLTLIDDATTFAPP